MRIRTYVADDDARWDAFCEEAPMATFLHTRRFLSYHGDRFQDASLVIENEADQIIGLLPAALAPDGQRIVSHPGATFGGLIHTGRLKGGAMIDAMTAVATHYRDRGYPTLRYKAVPRIYHRRPADDDLYALSRMGAQRVRCDLSCAIDLTNRGAISERRRRGAKKAAKSGIETAIDASALDEFWAVLGDNLASRHDARPVHTTDEMRLLMARFPASIHLLVARLGQRVIAGTLLFRTPTALHAQYIAAAPEGREMGALDQVFEAAIATATAWQCRYFDFGISNEDEGRHLNSGLYDFKAEFGASGVVHEFYDIDLTRSPPCP